MKILFVVNPISGGVDKEPFLKSAKELCNKYGISYSIFKTTGKNDKVELLKNLDQFKPDKVASVGGDGTTLFTAIALLGLGYPMGIIPLGSANGMAVELFVNADPLEALKDVLLSDMVRGLDLVKINDEHFTMHIGDVGINAQIVNSYEKDTNRGMATYAKYFLDELTKVQPFHVEVQSNSKSIKTEVVMFAICNARKYGTGVPLNKVSNPMDGQFELVLLEKISAQSVIRAGLASINDDFLDSQDSKVVVTDYAEVNFNKPRLLQLDGEVIGEYENLKIELLKGAVPLITSTDNECLID